MVVPKKDLHRIAINSDTLNLEACVPQGQDQLVTF